MDVWTIAAVPLATLVGIIMGDRACMNWAADRVVRGDGNRAWRKAVALAEFRKAEEERK